MERQTDVTGLAQLAEVMDSAPASMASRLLRTAAMKELFAGVFQPSVGTNT